MRFGFPLGLQTLTLGVFIEVDHHRDLDSGHLEFDEREEEQIE